jgi:hypothetical protein
MICYPSQPARVKAGSLPIMWSNSSTIMSTAPMSPAELPIVEIANSSGDRQAGPKQLLWSVEDGARVLPYSPGLSTGWEPHWHLGRTLWPTGA